MTGNPQISTLSRSNWYSASGYPMVLLLCCIASLAPGRPAIAPTLATFPSFVLVCLLALRTFLQLAYHILFLSHLRSQKGTTYYFCWTFHHLLPHYQPQFSSVWYSRPLTECCWFPTLFSESVHLLLGSFSLQHKLPQITAWTVAVAIVGASLSRLPKLEFTVGRSGPLVSKMVRLPDTVWVVVQPKRLHVTPCALVVVHFIRRQWSWRASQHLFRPSAWIYNSTHKICWSHVSQSSIMWPLSRSMRFTRQSSVLYGPSALPCASLCSATVPYCKVWRNRQ